MGFGDKNVTQVPFKPLELGSLGQMERESGGEWVSIPRKAGHHLRAPGLGVGTSLRVQDGGTCQLSRDPLRLVDLMGKVE